MSKNLTLEMLLARKQKSDNDQLKVKIFHSEVLDGDLEVHKQNIYKVLNKFGDVAEGLDGVEMFQNTCSLILEHVPLFKNKELLKEYECIEPLDIVPEIFDNNIGEINKLANFILSLYGLGDREQNIVDDIKN